MKRWLTATLILAPILALPNLHAGKTDDESKEALQALQDFIGGWKGSGTSEKNKGDIWKENASWSWRFKGKDSWLTVNADASKLFKSAEVRFLPDKSKYQFTLTDKQGAKKVYEGDVKKGVLTLERKNDAGDTEQIKINTAGGGDRLIWTFAVRPEGRSLFNKQYQVGYTKEGVTFGVAEGSKKPVCVVTGGLGTMQVTYMGQTYYVCCSGCRDAFNENPAKIIAQFKARKNK